MGWKRALGGAGSREGFLGAEREEVVPKVVFKSFVDARVMKRKWECREMELILVDEC